MPELTDTRWKLQIAMAALALVDAVAVVVLLSPLVGSATSRRGELNQLWGELQQKTRQVEPLRGLDQKVVVARGQIDSFYKDRLPDRDSTISADLGRLAVQNGVQIGQIKYKAKDPEAVGLRPVQIEADFSGDYLQLVRFINALERNQLFFLNDSVHLVSEQQGGVKLQLKLETYLKTGA
jgi:Tfp pilus assembly protein PilO